MEDYTSGKLKAYVEVRGGVVSLDLSGKRLSSLPDAVTELTEVQELKLDYNNLTELPTSINKLKNLIRLHLNGNKLTELPSVIGDLKELKWLDVCNNQLVSLPTSIQKLDQLNRLHLSGNKLTELPSEIGDLKELRRLYVSSNQLVSLPASIQKLNQLESLYLFRNRFTELPSEIGDLKELRRLDVSNNQLVSLPTSIQKMNQLEELNLSNNKLTELPSEIGDLKELRSLHVRNNQLASLPTSMQKLNQLEKLDLSGNRLTELPSEIGDLKELRWLDVSGNPLSMDAIDVLEMKKMGMTRSVIRGVMSMSSFKQTAESGTLSKVVETVLPVKAAKEEVVVEPEDETEVEDNTYVGESRSVVTEEIVTSEGTRWALKLGAVHLIFHPNAVSEPTSIVVYRWKSSVCSPPLQEHEAIVSNVIELSSHDGQRLQFNTMVTLSLSHSAPDLRGYEVVIKRQINKETNEWEDVSGTKNLRCRQDIKDERPSHKDVPDLLFPVAQADINECSTYAVVCRLKSSPPYTITSTGGLFIHPDYPGVTVTVPENAVAPESPFTLELKVQEVPNEEFEEEGVFLGPILRIKCSEVVQFFRPVTIQLPVSLRDRQDFKPDPTKCHVRVLFLNCEEEKKEWTELTDLVEPTQFDSKFVRIQVQRFSGYSYLFERLEENSRAYWLWVLSYLTRFTRTQPRAAGFVAYFRPDLPNILSLICCSAHLKQEVIQDLEKRDVTFADGISMTDMIPGEDGDKAFVFLSGRIRPFNEEDLNNIHLRLLEDDIPFNTELRVRLVHGEDLAQVEFRNTLKHTDRTRLLCKFHLKLPSRKMPSAPDQDSRELARQPEPASNPPEVTLQLLKTEDLPKTGVPWDDGRLPTDILLLTVEDCEFLGCLSYLNSSFCRSYCKELGCVYFGELGRGEMKVKMAVMKCYKGSITAGGSAVSVSPAVRVLRPKAVFLVGICYSLKSSEVKLGDVAISEKLITCVPSSDEAGDKVPLKSLFLKLIPNAGDGWKAPLKDPKALEVKIHRGDLLSVPGVIDNNECRETLIKRFPHAIAMELEGQGLYAAAHALDVPWIIIKGISDYADCRKSGTDRWRSFASLMAASLTAHVLSDPVVFQDWPHYKETH